MEKETIMIDGVRYYADRPRSCRGCYFWKNTVVTRTIQGLLRFPDILVTLPYPFGFLNSSHTSFPPRYL